MPLILKNKDTIEFKGFFFRCSIGKNGKTKRKIEGDKKTPSGSFKIGNLYYRPDRNLKPITKLKCIKIKKNMGWCNDVKKFKKYNKLINTKEKLRHEKLFRKDYKYDFLIPVKYNYKNPKTGKGSAIFIHLTKNYRPTAGCIALAKKDFLIMLKLISQNTSIIIN
tara:strand:+ start:829 stop:1323 length:495 start_codon:yes stop_codon:yes gene_type:complete